MHEYERLRRAIARGQRHIVSFGPGASRVVPEERDAEFESAWAAYTNGDEGWGLPVQQSWPVLTTLLHHYATEHWVSVCGLVAVLDCWMERIENRGDRDPNTWDSLRTLQVPPGGKIPGLPTGAPLFEAALSLIREHRGNVMTRIWKELAVVLSAPAAPWNVNGFHMQRISETASRTMTLFRCTALHACQPYSPLQDRPFANDLMWALSSWGYQETRGWWRRFVTGVPVHFSR